MKRFHAILAGLALAALSVPSWAFQLPVTADGAGSAITNKVTAIGSSATTLAVSAKSNAFLTFGLSGFTGSAASVTKARLILFITSVNKPGTLNLKASTVFAESTTTATAPAIGAQVTQVAITAANKKHFVIIDVTADVQSATGSDIGYALTADSTLNVLIGAKEGSGSGYPAVLEIEANPSGGVISATSVTATGTLMGGSFNSTGSIIVGGDVDATGNVTANLFASSSMATDNLTAHVNANIQGTSTFGGKATFNGQSVFAGDVNLNSGKTLGGGGSINLGGNIECTNDGRIGSTLAVGAVGGFAQRGTLDVRGKSGSITPAGGTVLSFIVLNSAFIGSSNNFDLSSGSGIFCDSDIIGGSINALSDERIKDIQGRSDSGADLTKMLQLEVTDYFYKDRFYRGHRPQKKLIAQQVEKIFPQAVSQHTDVVPDIYQAAESADGWVSLATDLQVGDRVRLIGAKQSEDGVYEVLEVGESGFRTTFQPEGAKVFVYGREVKDFRTVDYEAVAMLNVSATQEIAKQLQAKDAELTKLRAAHDALAKKLAAFEARDAELQARLTRLEAGLSAARAPLTTAALERK